MVFRNGSVFHWRNFFRLNPFQTIKEANELFPTAAEFRLARVDVRFGEKRLAKRKPDFQGDRIQEG